MRIAIIGGGISGLGAAWALRETHEITLFEREPRLGGHANTIDIADGERSLSVDTGFVVFNERNYPNFTALLAHLGVASNGSDMSFSVSDPRGFEWSSGGLAGMFAWKRNLARPAFLAMLTDILRFNSAARVDVERGALTGETLEDYIARLRLSPQFLQNYLLPMGAAIWSTPEREMLAYPAASFLKFFDNHRLLHTSGRIPWRTVAGGSQTYVQALRAALGPRVRLGEPALEVARDDGHVRVRSKTGVQEFDQIIFACHSDQALALLSDGDSAERNALAAIAYASNTAYLHGDARLMPRRRAAWASWNYLRCGNAPGRVCVSYWMNRLQRLDTARQIFVTLNPATPPAESATYARFTYDHPQFNRAALAAQETIHALQGARRTWFAGAWLGHGFHEDGLRAGLIVAQKLGARLPWRLGGARSRAPAIVGAPAAAPI
jgi:hypothetical protein